MNRRVTSFSHFDRVYRRGLVLGLSLAELFLILLFLLLLTLAGYSQLVKEEQTTQDELARDLHETIDEKNVTIGTITGQLVTAQTTIDTKEQELSDALTKIRDLQNQLAEIKPADPRDLETINENLQSENENLEKDIQEVKDSLASTEHIAKQLETEVQEQAARNDQLQSENTALATENDNLAATQAQQQKLENDNQKAINDLKQDKQELDQKIKDIRDQLENEISELQAEKEGLEEQLSRYYQLVAKVEETKRQLLKELQQKLADEGIDDINVDFDRGVIGFPEDLLFESGQAEITPTGQNVIQAMASALIDVLPCYSNSPIGFQKPRCKHVPNKALATIFVEGHTDPRPIRSSIDKYKNNWDLSSWRAINTFNGLVSQDSELDEFKNKKGQKLLSIAAYEARRGVAPNYMPSGRMIPSGMEKNRRVDIRFLMSPPSAKDLKAIDASMGSKTD